MNLCCGIRNLVLTLSAFLSSSSWAQSPVECLQQDLAAEQSSAYLQALTSLPTPPFVPLITRGEARFVNTSALFAEVLEVSPRAIILNDLEELRFISMTLAGTPLLLVLREATDWTEAKSRKVVAVAQTLNLTISLVWLDENPVPRQLLSTIEATYGRVFRLNVLNRAVLEKFCMAN